MRGMSRNRARRLRHDQTDAERTLWARLRERRLIDAKFRRQHPVGAFITDFCCLERGLVVELDGSQHATQLEADKKRTDFLAARGFRVLRFWDNEVFENIEGILHVIAQALRDPLPLTPPSPPSGERVFWATSPPPGERIKVRGDRGKKRHERA